MNQPHEPPLETIQLDQFLKLTGLVGTGGQAKLLIQSGQVFVNGEAETRRKRQLVLGDTVQFENQQFDVSAEDDA